jgi:hypothetical protein
MFFANEFFTQDTLLPRIYFFTRVFFYKWLFLQSVFFSPISFTGRVFFYTWVFVHNIWLSSPTLDILTCEFFLQSMSIPGMSVTCKTCINKSFTQNTSPRVDSFYTMGSINERFVGVLARHALFPGIYFLHVCFFTNEFFYRAYVSSGLPLLVVFYTWVFLHNTRLSSLALDVFYYMGVFLFTRHVSPGSVGYIYDCYK